MHLYAIINYHTSEIGRQAMEDRRYTYYAFISYKHEDTKWARWLQKKLQGYRLLTRTCRQHANLPKRLTPVFLDRSHLLPGPLNAGVRKEVQDSKYLIVVCSRASGEESHNLDQEIEDFLAGGGDRSRIIPFIVDKAETPEITCFPAKLRALCEEETILGANIHDNGPRHALLKVIASMQGLKLEEVESEDSRRRRRNRLAILAVSFVLLLAAAYGGTQLWKSWDFNREKTAYYLDYTEQWGEPVGIGELTPEELQTIPAHYVLITQRGKARTLRHENSYGTLVPTNNIYLKDRPTRAEYDYTENGSVSTVTCYDASGKAVLVKSYSNGLRTVDLRQSAEQDAYGGSMALQSHTVTGGNLLDLTETLENETKSNIKRYLLDYDADGYVRELRYAANSDNDMASDADGVAGLRYTRDALGRVVREEYLTYIGDAGSAARAEDYDVIGMRNGVCGMEYLYNAENDM